MSMIDWIYQPVRPATAEEARRGTMRPWGPLITVREERIFAWQQG